MKPETSDPYLAMLVNLCEFGPESEGWKNIGEITNTNRKTRHMKFKSSQTNIYKYARKLVTDGLAEEMKKIYPYRTRKPKKVAFRLKKDVKTAYATDHRLGTARHPLAGNVLKGFDEGTFLNKKIPEMLKLDYFQASIKNLNELGKGELKKYVQFRRNFHLTRLEFARNSASLCDTNLKLLMAKIEMWNLKNKSIKENIKYHKKKLKELEAVTI